MRLFIPLCSCGKIIFACSSSSSPYERCGFSDLLVRAVKSPWLFPFPVFLGLLPCACSQLCCFHFPAPKDPGSEPDPGTSHPRLLSARCPTLNLGQAKKTYGNTSSGWLPYPLVSQGICIIPSLRRCEGSGISLQFACSLLSQFYLGKTAWCL